MTRQPFGKLQKVTDDDKHTAAELLKRIDFEIVALERDIAGLKNQIQGLQFAKAVIEQSIGV